jgi:hypothetical protein
MTRYVVLRHETPADADRPDHWDLMFETGDVLRTWACDTLPQAGRSVEARQLVDHRPAYLDYEGPVSGHRGTVTRWDEGTYQLVEDRPERWVVRLCGRHFNGCLLLFLADATAGLWRAQLTASASS